MSIFPLTSLGKDTDPEPNCQY